MTFFPYLWIYMDIVFEQLHLLMLGTQLEAVPADTVSFELCIYSYLIASCSFNPRCNPAGHFAFGELSWVAQMFQLLL